jgi:hypothetical protein
MARKACTLFFVGIAAGTREFSGAGMGEKKLKFLLGNGWENR